MIMFVQCYLKKQKRYLLIINIPSVKTTLMIKLSVIFLLGD